MLVQFHDYDPEKTEVDVMQDTLSRSTLHIEIANEDEMDSIKIYMREEDIEGFIHKVSKALDKYKGYQRRK